MKNKRGKLLDIALPVLTVLCIVTVWAAAAAIEDEELLLPRPLSALKEFFALFGERRFYAAFAATFLRSLAAFSVSFVAAFAAAFASAHSRAAGKVFDTLVSFMRALPTVAVVLLFVLWMRSGTAAIAVTALVILPTLYTNSRAALDAADKGVLEMCKVYGVKPSVRFFKVSLPMVAPELIAAAGAGFSLNLKLMVAAEVLAQTANGLGMLMNRAKVYFETAELMALVVVSLAVGLIFEALGNLISRRMKARYA